jgi:hypothetical protein
MSKHIYVPSCQTHALHLGASSEYKKLYGCWFEQKYPDQDNLIYKSLIYDIKFEPDLTYHTNDGYCGTCWIAQIIESAVGAINYYHFRNFEDLVALYDTKGYKFVRESE